MSNWNTKILALCLVGSAMLLPVASASAQDGGRPLQAMLTGSAEVPGPGDADGSGQALIKVNAGQGQVCYEVNVEKIGTPTAAHIHLGSPDAAGDVVVTFTPPTGSACVDVTKELAKAILKTPSDYYVNVHNAEFPKGAVRGQLSK